VNDPFYGQDAYYRRTEVDLIDTGGTVFDNITGLTWQKQSGPESDGNWSDAQTYCQDQGMRLPTRRELLSIVNYGASFPASFDIFMNTAGEYWTSSENVKHKDNAWLVNFDGGFSSGYLNKTYYRHVLCVQGPEFPEPSIVEITEGIAKDNTTGYWWQKVAITGDSGAALTWEDALSACENSTLGEYTDWMLPDIKQLESLVNIRSSNDLVYDTNVFQDSYGSYWSSTTDASQIGTAWYVDFLTGNVDSMSSWKEDTGMPKYVRCVRIP